MEYDVIVVGAGPGGSTAARQCALHGLKTLLLEKEKLPRYKACGGGVTMKAISLLDFKIRDELVEREGFGAQLHYGRYEIKVKKPYMLGVLVSRDAFDFYLAEKAVDAGVELRDDERVRSLEVHDSYVVVKTNIGAYKAAIVVGADGVNSIVSRRVRRRFKPEELGLALEAEIPFNVDEMDDPDMIRMYFGISPEGYGWVFPKREHLSVGIAGILSEFRESQKTFTGFLKKRGLDTDVRFHAHLIPSGGYERSVCSDRIILVGDAAGYVDSFLGEGIPYAIHSGKIAAGIVSESHEEGDFSEKNLSRYKHECYDAFGENLKDSLIFSRLMHRFPGIFIKSAAVNKAVMDKYLDIAVGDVDYRDFRKWLLLRAPYYALKGVISK